MYFKMYMCVGKKKEPGKKKRIKEERSTKEDILNYNAHLNKHCVNG